MTLGSTEPYEAEKIYSIPEPLVPKFALDQLVYYMRDNKVHSANVMSIKVVMNLHEEWASTNEQKDTWLYFGPTCILYKTVHCKLNESEVFASREELLESL